jgi:tRNA(Arg) A34 adenosine deaminase TadA
MCTGAIWWAAISRIVIGVSYQRFAAEIAREYHYIPIEEVYRQLHTPIEVAGPVLEDEGMEVYTFWPAGE